MKTIRIIPARHWQHASGARASMYGAVPWTSAADRANWKRAESGFTWEIVDTFGRVTIGLGRKPAETLEDAQAAAEAWRAVSPEHREILTQA